MSAPASSPPRSDFAIGLLVYALSGVAFFPLARFIFGQTVNQDQLLHSFIVLVVAGALLVYERRVKLHPVWELGRWARWLLFGAYGLVLVVLFTGVTVLMVPAFSLAIASAVIFVFGERVKRFTGALVGAFALFQAFVLVLPVLDWPLRGVAGQFSGWVLDLLGREVQLGLYQPGTDPSLILISDGHPFRVAPECNGFGVTVSCLLLALLLVLYRRTAVGTKVATVLGAGLLGLASNTLRIVIIVLLAPLVGQERYMLMHEIVGTITYYAALIAIWWIVQKLPARRESPAAAPPTKAAQA